MAEIKDKKKQDVVGEASPAPKVEKKNEPEKLFIIGEQAVNALLSAIAQNPKLSWMDANPMITLLQQNLKEVKNDA